MADEQKPLDDGSDFPSPIRTYDEIGSRSDNPFESCDISQTNRENDGLLDRASFTGQEEVQEVQIAKAPWKSPQSKPDMENPFEPSTDKSQNTRARVGCDSQNDRHSLALNAFAPPVTAVEQKKLIDFDPRWWIEHLDTNRGRSIELACLETTALGNGQDSLLMSAVIASWVFYFPSDFNLLAQNALDRWSESELENVMHLTADHFMNAFHLENCERYATGRVAMVLDAVTQLLTERSVRHQQHHPDWQNRGQGQGRGPGL